MRLSRGNTFALMQRRHVPPVKVCRHGTTRKQRRYIWSASLSFFGATGAMSTLRTLAVIYVVQAGVGMATGVAYTLWLLYW
jgi:hypothetical protein